MFHGLCDGLGLNRFIEATLYHYFCLKDGKEYSDEGITTAKVPYDPKEIEDGFADKEIVDTKELKKLSRGNVRFRLPELKTGKGPLIFRYPVRIKTEDLLSWSKNASASPATAVSAFLSQAVAKENTIQEGVVMTCVPFSIRKFLNIEQSFKNCATAIFLPVSPEDCRNLSAGELAAKMRMIMKSQMNDEFVKLQASAINMVTHLGKKLPTYFLKNKVMAMPENHPQDTFTIDYVGGLKTNDYSAQISEVRYLNPDPYKGSLTVCISETAGYFFINFNQTFDSPLYYNTFIRILESEHIPYEKLEKDTYLNPQVELPPEQR
jgi:hypothetical protein